MQYSKYFPFTLLSSIYFWSFCCALNCSDEPFDCGNIAYIAYPFWGGPRSSDCGRKGFEIVCNNNDPILKISYLSYRVEKLDFTTNTLIVARQDLEDTFCPHTPRNTTLDWDLFQYPYTLSRNGFDPGMGPLFVQIFVDRNLTLYFDCTAQQPPPPNAFTCADDTYNLFKIGDVSSSDFGNGITCNNNISVPINKQYAESLQNPNASAVKTLRSALLTGFSIQWFSDKLQRTPPFCNSKVYGSCSSGGGAPVPSPTESIPLGPTPAGAPSSPRSGYGLPPAPSIGYYPQDTAENRTTKIIIGLAIGVVGMITVSISIHCILKIGNSVISPNPDCKPDVEGFLLQWGSLTPKRYKYSEIKKITKSLADKLGEGGYGSVYKGMLPNGVPVAVKVLSETKSNGEDFINEVASISRTSHVNIVTLLGFCYEGNKRALVYELMPNSSLDKFLSNNDCLLDSVKLYKIAVGIAKGLEYLHTGCTTRIVHFDIKPQNILLDEEFCPKISDFGLAKLCKKKQSVLSVVGMRGTIGYIAPEVFSRNFGGVSHKSDVYSYGMMILEMAGVAGKGEVIRSSENYFPDRIYEEVISEVGNDLNLIMEEKEERRKKMILVGFWCIQTIPPSRPSISQVLEMFEGSLESMQIPPKPILLTPPIDLLSHDQDEVSSSFVEMIENSGVEEILTLELSSTIHTAVSNPN